MTKASAGQRRCAVNNDPVHGAEPSTWLALHPTLGERSFFDRRRDPIKKAIMGALDRRRAHLRQLRLNSDPFEASRRILQQAAPGWPPYGGRVYGIWMEKPKQSSKTADEGKEKASQGHCHQAGNGDPHGSDRTPAIRRSPGAS